MLVPVPSLSTQSLYKFIEDYSASYCILDLDDNGGFTSTVVGKAAEKDKLLGFKKFIFNMRIHDAHIIYSGGKILPIDRIEFTNCTFDIGKPTAIPGSSGRAITSQLLTASLDKGVIKLPTVY